MQRGITLSTLALLVSLPTLSATRVVDASESEVASQNTRVTDVIVAPFYHPAMTHAHYIREDVDVLSVEFNTNSSELNTIPTYDMRSIDYTELGVSVEKTQSIGDQMFSFGVSPKLQTLKTYKQSVAPVAPNIEEDDDQSERSKSAFNVDLGVIWRDEHFGAGIRVTDLLKQKIDGENKADSYSLAPQITITGSYVSDYFSAAVDADLTEQEHFSTADDNTQFVRFGVQSRVLGWAQLRGGYEVNMAGSLSDAVTAGIEVTPFDIMSFDLTGSYAGEHQFGATANLEFTF